MSCIEERKRKKKRKKKEKVELFFFLNRYTSQAKTKKGNRQSEFLLREVELWWCSSFALLGKYPAESLLKLWQLVLLTQFHDVLPGSSIGLVYKDAEGHLAHVLEQGRALLDQVKEERKIIRVIFHSLLFLNRLLLLSKKKARRRKVDPRVFHEAAAFTTLLAGLGLRILKMVHACMFLLFHLLMLIRLLTRARLLLSLMLWLTDGCWKTRCFEPISPSEDCW